MWKHTLDCSPFVAGEKGRAIKSAVLGEENEVERGRLIHLRDGRRGEDRGRESNGGE